MVPTTTGMHGVLGAGKVLLVNYAGYFLTANTFVPDNSLASLASMLVGHGIDVEILDLQGPRDVGRVMDATDRRQAQGIVDCLRKQSSPSTEQVRAYHADRRRGEAVVLAEQTEALLNKVEREGIRLVGFKLWAGEGLLGAVAMATALRQAFPHVVLVAGGPAVQYGGPWFSKLTSVFDHLVSGDGEDALLRLALGRRAHVGATLRKQGELDRLPFPLYDPAIYPNIDEFFKLRILDESRGCFNRCAFCAHPHLNGTRSRERTPVLVVDEIERTLHRDGIRHFRLSGSNPRWCLVQAIGKEILKRGLNVRWAVFSSMNNVCAEDLPWLAQSGLCSLFFGIESGDEYLLRRVHQKNNRGADHIVHVCETAMSCGIYLSLSLIVPSPGETDSSRLTTLRLMERVFAHHQHGSVLVLPAFLTPGSRWWNEMDRFGFSFEPGLDRESYVLRGLTLSNDFLLPREAWSDYGYRLDGKTGPEILGECEAFIQRLSSAGITTHVDDTAFLLADLGNIDPRAHKARISEALVLGGADPLLGYVTELNQARPQTSAARRMALASRSSGATIDRFGAAKASELRSDFEGALRPPRHEEQLARDQH